MVNLIYLLSLLIAFLTGFFVAIKAVHLGLKWNIQTAEKKEPELKSVFSPVVEAVQNHKAERQAEYAQSQFAEWINGEIK